MKYVFDTSSVIVLLEICALKEQLRAFSAKHSLYVSSKVREEFMDGCKTDREALNIFSVVQPISNKDLLAYFNQKTSSGEFWTISYGCSEGDCICVLDDGFGRNLCQFLNIKYTGSIGIINEMKNEGFLSRKDLLEIRGKIRNSNFYLSKTLLDRLDEICFQ